MTPPTTSNSKRKNGVILASIIVISVLAFFTFSSILFEANQFHLRSQLYSNTSIYEHAVKLIYPVVDDDGSLDIKRGVEGLYYSPDDDDDTVNDDDIMIQTENIWNPSLVSPEHIQQILTTKASKNAELLPSPVCHPHFNLALRDGKFNNQTKFKRIHLYHARKAGGSSMSQYFSTVARTYGLDYKATEWDKMEEPGYGEKDTFYVAHLREPVDRAISHFKYEGRWGCRDLIRMKSGVFVPTEENANKLETWTETGGHTPLGCRTLTNGEPYFKLGSCAVDCYTQWFSGLSCPAWNISAHQQYTVAKRRVLRYNLIVVIEKLRDPAYVDAIEQMFGVIGITKKSVPFCERPSHRANLDNPLIIQNSTRERLTTLNALDIKLYNELGGCLNDDTSYNFPKWDPSRFDIGSWNWTEAKMRANATKEHK